MPTTDQLVTGVDFVTIPASDIGRAVTFYSDVIGLPITRDQRPEGLDWVEMDAGGICVGVVRPDAFGGKFEPVKFAGVALRVADVERTMAHLAKVGIKFHHEDTGVCHMIFFDDTEGNGVCLHKRYAPEA